VSHANKALKKGEKCLLRSGVQEWDTDARGRDEKPSQLSERQSFIACMAALRQDPHPKTIAEMKQIILDGITLDSFLAYQNGTLVDVFKPAPEQEKEVLGAMYKNTKYVQKMKAHARRNPAAAMAAVTNAVNAYENFRRFIESNDSVIDHTYMWDIFTTLNQKIFPAQKVGFNLIILEVPKDDNSDALNIVCPSNHYSNNFFDVRKMTVVLIKQYNYYEPVFQFTDHEDAKKTDVKTSFSLSAPTLMPNLKVMIELRKDRAERAPGGVTPGEENYNYNAAIVSSKDKLKPPVGFQGGSGGGALPEAEPDDEIMSEHNRMLDTILEEEELLITAHRMHIEETMEMVRSEMNLLTEVDQPGSAIDQYVERLDAILKQKLKGVEELKAKLESFKEHLQQEEIITNTVRIPSSSRR
jgi:hypothetical protein